MWLIQNPQWGSNFHWISAANEEMSGNFISHLLDFGFNSVLKSLGIHLVLDSLSLLLVTSVGVSYREKVYNHSDLSNIDNRSFSIMIPLQILRKSDPVLCAWSNSKSRGEDGKIIAGMTYGCHFVPVIGDSLL